MASLPNFLDDDVQSLYDDGLCQYDLVERVEPSVIECEEPVILTPSSNITLTSLNTDNSEAECDNFFGLDFEIEGHEVTHFNLISSDISSKEQLNLQEDPSIRSQSPMSWTASMSGSEPRSPASTHHSEDDSGEDLLEYLLQDTDIKIEQPPTKKIKSMGPAATEMTTYMPRPKAKQQRQTRSSTSSNVTRGVGKQSVPWSNTTHRNNNRNAITARENRLKKKQYIENLVDSNEQLSSENSTLKKEATTVQKKVRSLEEEIKYLHKVLFNQSALAGLLKKLNQSEVGLSTNHHEDETEDDGASASCSGGMCLHVNGTNTTLKMCARCAREDQP